MHGYYLFFGRGDWGTSRAQSLDPTFNGSVPTRVLGDWGAHRQGTPLELAPEWSSGWSLATWKERVDYLADVLGADTLMLLMSGFELPYASRRFPEAVERDHANVRDEFLPELLEYTVARGMTVFAQFCTTGHAKAYAAAHPECTTVAANGARHPTNLCPHHPLGRAYAEGVAEEVLTRYRGFAGVSFHPPENAVPCHCEHCQTAFERDSSRSWRRASEQDISDFYWAACLRFQRKLEKRASRIVPDACALAITIPGRFEADFDKIAAFIPRATLLMHWDYWNFGDRIASLLNSLRRFQAHGHRVGFMPSAGWALDACGPAYGRQVVAQIEAVRAFGVCDILYFTGAIWHESSLRATAVDYRGPLHNA